LETVAISPDQFAQVIKTDLDHWGKLVRASGAKVD